MKAADPHSPTNAIPGSTANPALSAERLVNKFPDLEILHLIGQGGMGAVYQARQTNLDRLVALKILSPRLGSDPSFAERFAREARTLAKLSHPNIVTVFDFGQVDEIYYLVMEYVEGVNLRDTIEAKTLDPEKALAVVPQICDALQYAHDKGVVHRDIKPENILVSVEGGVKIADFGLAKLLEPTAEDFTLTNTRQVMGTLKYMAPEQIEKPEEVDHRADLYSLGVVFYELLTGELPIGRFSVPSEKAAINDELDQVVMKTLEKEADRRYQQASQIKTAVADARVCVPPVKNQASPPVKNQTNSTGQGGLILLGGGLVLGSITLMLLTAMMNLGKNVPSIAPPIPSIEANKLSPSVTSEITLAEDPSQPALPQPSDRLGADRVVADRADSPHPSELKGVDRVGADRADSPHPSELKLTLGVVMIAILVALSGLALTLVVGIVVWLLLRSQRKRSNV